jgi:pimeloyl-ACP methyl ester carboxylesterase
VASAPALVPAVLSALALGAGPDAGIAAWLAAHAPALAAVGLAAIGLAVISRIVAWIRISMNIFIDRSLPVTVAPRDYEPAEGDLVTFLSRDGHTLAGMFVDPPAGRPDRGTILFCHEFGSDMTSAGRYARALVGAGYRVFAFDFRGHGRSPAPPHFEPRHWPSHHEVNDVLAAVAFVRDRLDLGGGGLGVLGISRGASAAIVAAALSPHIRCLALDSAFSTDTSIDHLIVRWARVYTSIKVDKYGRPIWICRFVRAVMLLYVELKLRCRYPSAQKAMARLAQVPMLFITGERDAYSPVREQQVLFDAKAGEKELWICPNAKHNQAVATDPRAYAEKVVAFFDRHLGGPAAARG